MSIESGVNGKISGNLRAIGNGDIKWMLFPLRQTRFFFKEAKMIWTLGDRETPVGPAGQRSE